MNESDVQAFSLNGLTCFVTGAGSGIGEAIAKALSRQGASVVVNDVDPAAAQRTCEAIGESLVHGAQGDASDPAVAKRMISAAIAARSRIDVLVNNAAAPVGLSRFLDIPTEEWPRHLSSFFATLACTRAVLPHMVSQGWGRIVNITSIAGVHGVDQMVLYGAGKGAIHALTAGLAKEVALDGVTINCVAPGVVDTPRQRSRPADELIARKQRVPIGRFAEPEEIAHAVVYLASREAAYVTGEVLMVDGGRP